ncbi:MAG TPA: DNA polymerase IV, partial [Bacillota bacterium]|nr:DNA polymerase IV [Bacillota bacterium]
MPKMLIDCDAFFASCEQSKNPRLRGKKVMVAGDTERRSVITAASYEAKACGVKAGMPIQEARRLVPDGIFVVGDLNLYLDFNLKLFKQLLTYQQPVELYSIDEFYLDFRGDYEQAAQMARDFKEWVRRELKITVSAGIAPTKVYAKLASEMQKPDGLVVLRPEDIPAKVQHLSVRELFGVGAKTDEIFRRFGIRTIGDLRAYNPFNLEVELGVRGRWLYEAAMAQNDEIVKVTPDPYKSMGNEMTLPEDTNDPDRIRAFLCFLSDTVAQRLRADGSVARTVHLHVRYSDFSGFYRSKTMVRPMNLAEQLLEGATILLEKHHKEKERMIRLLGIGVSNLMRAQGVQLSLFPEDQRRLALAGALDQI